MSAPREKGDIEPGEPRCGRCGSGCELSNPGGDPARWECVQCWVYVLVPRKAAAPLSGVRAGEVWRRECLVFSVASAPLDELPAGKDELGRRG